MSTIEVKVPDIGDFKDVPVIELLVKPGDSVKAEDSLVTLESDKATMDVPSPSAGKVKDLKVKLGDKVSEGSVLLTLDADGAGAQAKPASAPSPQRTSTAPAPSSQPGAAAKPAAPASDGAAGQAAVVDIKVPDIGDFKDVPVIEVLVKAGDEVKPEDALVTLESDKATMDVPSPSGGKIKELKVKVGDKVSEGSVISTPETPGVSAPQQPKEAPLTA